MIRTERLVPTPDKSHVSDSALADRPAPGYGRSMTVVDGDPGFDTLAYVRRLKTAGVGEKQAEAHAEAARAARAGLATKADLDTLESRIDVKIAALRADLYRALWIQTGALAGTIVATAGVVIAAVKLL